MTPTLFDQDVSNEKVTEIKMPEYNRFGNDAQYQENKDHFKNQTQIVLNHLLKGETVTGAKMYELHKIQDIRPRIASIKKSLIGTQHCLVEKRIIGGHGAKEWKLERIESVNKAA